MPTVEQWKAFFESSGIPAEQCPKFARTFHSQRIQPDMIEELDRETFSALGVVTIGEQFQITRYARKCKGDIPEFGARKEPEPARRVSAAPDRHDAYHKHLPKGETPKTREIIKKHDALKEEGVIKRGTNGVRKGGELIAGLTRVSATSTVISKRKPGVVAAPSVVLKSPGDSAGPRRTTIATIPKYGTLVSDSMVSGSSTKSRSDLMVSDVSSSSMAGRLRSTTEPSFVITLGDGGSRSGLSSRLSGGSPSAPPLRGNVRSARQRAPVSSRLGTAGSSRRPVVVYANHDDDYEMEEEVIYRGKPSVFDRVSAKKRF